MEDKAAARCKQPAIPWPWEFNRPARFLRHGVPCGELAFHRAIKAFANAKVRGKIASAKIKANVETARTVGLPICFRRVDGRCFERGNVDEIFVRMIGHRVPVVTAKRTRHHNRRRSGFVDPCLWIEDRTPVFINPFGPSLRDVRLGRNKLARRAVEHIKEPVLGRLHQDLTLLTLDLHIGKDNVLCRGVVPSLTRGCLIMPDIFARIWVQSDNAGEVKVVALSGAVLARRAIGAVPGAPIANPDVEEVKLCIIGHGVPNGAAAANGIGASEGFHIPSFSSRFEVVGRVISLGPVRYGVEAPQLAAILDIVSCDITAHAEFCAAIADDDLAIDDARRAGDGIGHVLVDGNNFPIDLARLTVERDKPPIKRAKEKVVTPSS